MRDGDRGGSSGWCEVSSWWTWRLMRRMDVGKRVVDVLWASRLGLVLALSAGRVVRKPRDR